MPSKEEVAWVAGILEGEGTFGFTDTYSPFIQIAMTDLDIIERVNNLLSNGESNILVIDGVTSNHKTQYKIKLHGEYSINWMKLILPFMGNRRTEKINEIFTKYYSKPRRAFGKCKRGHDTTKEGSYYINYTTHGKTCKECLKITTQERKDKKERLAS